MVTTAGSPSGTTATATLTRGEEHIGQAARRAPGPDAQHQAAAMPTPRASERLADAVEALLQRGLLAANPSHGARVIKRKVGGSRA